MVKTSTSLAGFLLFQVHMPCLPEGLHITVLVWGIVCVHHPKLLLSVMIWLMNP